MRIYRTMRALGNLALAGMVLAGCEKEFDLGTLPRQPDLILDTSYVAFTPSFGGYAGAEAVMVGRDQFLYVADTRANRVVMLNTAGQFMSARDLLHPVSLAQDSRLDLLVGGEVVAANGDTIGAIFRLHVFAAGNHLDQTRVDTTWLERARPARRFPGITVFGDNSYLAVRSGPDNSSLIDPDGRVLVFDDSDNFITPLPALTTRVGTGITDINKLTGIASFPNVRDFVLIQSSEGVAYGAIWMTYQKTNDFDGWIPQFDPANPDQVGTDFIRPNRFLEPSAVAIDRARRDIFIVDAGLDSVFKFDSRGRFKKESFGRVRSGGELLRPTGVAFFNTVLYVLDGESGQILRYRLSTDVPR